MSTHPVSSFLSSSKWSGYIFAAVAAAAIGAYALVFLPLLPEPGRAAGLDYSYFLPQLLAGYYWFSNNGLLSIPWFTPAFCAGVPYFANMQGTYLSLPQFLMFVVNSFQALQIAFMTFAVAGFGGFYALSRNVFGMSRWIALAAGVIFLFNGFYPARFIAGHIAFHAFMLMPIVAISALAGAREVIPQRSFDTWVLVGALTIAYMVHSGMVHALLPSLLAVVAVILVHGYLFGLRATPFFRLMFMGGIALALSAAKLAAAIAYISHFPREMVPLLGFDGFWRTLYIALRSLFVAPAIDHAAVWLQNNQWFPDFKVLFGPHELEYGVTFIPALATLTWITRKLIDRFHQRSSIGSLSSRTLIVLAFTLLLSVPIFLNWYEPSWTAFLKTVPLLGNSSTLIRWLCLYIPVAALVGMLCIERERMLATVRPLVALGIIAAVISINISTDWTYYVRRGNYDVTDVTVAHAALRGGASIPTIERVEWPPTALRDLTFKPGRSDSFVGGGTNAKCYEPMFGHRLEEYPFGILREGPTLEVNDGQTNIKNPACMLYPEANECRPGDHFSESEIASATAFTSYKPFPFQMPWWQKVANGISLIALVSMLGGFVFYGVAFLRRRRPKST